MELELGLALALPGFHMNMNDGVVEKPAEVLGWSCDISSGTKTRVGNKRSFDVALAGVHQSKMLPLLLWNGQPNEEDGDDDKEQNKTNNPFTSKDDEEGKNHVVGWPPIKSWRKKMLHHEHHGHHDRRRRGPHPNNNNNNGMILGNYCEENYGLISSENSMYVKVKMEGVGIVRKIDISLHHSYHTLKHALIAMFSNSKRCDKEDGADYILTYLDKQGNWLLAADHVIPWQRFMESVQRLQIRRKWWL